MHSAEIIVESMSEMNSLDAHLAIDDQRVRHTDMRIDRGAQASSVTPSTMTSHAAGQFARIGRRRNIAQAFEQRINLAETSSPSANTRAMSTDNPFKTSTAQRPVHAWPHCRADRQRQERYCLQTGPRSGKAGRGAVIVNADSAQLYSDLPILSAAPAGRTG
jgi:hypothetical protein